jgi:hypothetical protein
MSDHQQTHLQNTHFVKEFPRSEADHLPLFSADVKKH